MIRDIDKFIDDELEYFEPMISRQRKTTNRSKEKWGLETIRERHERVSLEMYDTCNGEVKYGLFTGLKLQRSAWWGKLDLGSQCLGLYEKEVLNFLSDCPKYKYKTFVDIGAGDGYYANGILKAGITNEVICFESNSKGRDAIVASWVLNGKVGDLQVYGEANECLLEKVFGKELSGALILVDIEGNEFDLLNDNVLSKFRHSDMLIEVHNWVSAFEQSYPSFLRRCIKYFDVEILPRVERPTITIPELRSYTDDNRLLLTSERRPCLMRFLKLTPLAN